MASAMSVTWNSSKHNSHASCDELRGRQPDRILAFVLADFHLLAKAR